MLGFAPLSATPLSALPVTGSTFSVESLGVVSKFGTPVAIWDQFGEAAGFSATLFGTPTNRLTQPVAGFSSVQFGTPAGYKLQRATGFCSTAIGTPRLFPFHVAPGIHETQFGTPVGRQYWRASPLGPVARFGTPTTRFNQTQNVSGFRTTQFGTPFSIRHAPPFQARICLARGFIDTAFGIPSVRWPQTGNATGFLATHLGTPRAVSVCHASSLGPVAAFGTPVARQIQRAAGFVATAFGISHAILTQRIIGAAPSTRFGAPEAVRSNWYVALGFLAAKVGTPHGIQRNNYWATGFCPTHIGTPACRQVHRIAAIPPITRFGNPTLKRNTQC